MLELVKQIKEYTEAGIILNHMHLFDRLEDYFAPIESCDNCIYNIEESGLCSNSVVTNIFSDVEIKGNWCELWRSEDEVVRNSDGGDPTE